MNAFTSSRRGFLKTAGTAAVALTLARSGRAAAGGAGASAVGAGATRVGELKRGLLFDEGDVAQIRANLELPRFAAIREAALGGDLAADEKFLREEVKVTDHITDMARVRTILEQRAFAYAVTRDERQLAVAKLALTRLGDFEKWDYFLEGGTETIGFQRAPEATIAACCALDWLGETLSAEERARVEEQIATRGAPACYRSLYGMKYPDRVRGWSMDPAEHFPMKLDLSRWPLILNATNLKVIPTCGLGLAGIWLHGRHPEAERWLELARQSARAFATMYGTDGCYDEGVGYWGYTTMHLILFAEAMYRRLGIDERNLINYPGTVRYALSMTMPTRGKVATNAHEKKEYNATPKGALDPSKGMVNFGDSGVAIDVSIAPWVARTHGDELSAYVAREVGAMQLWPAAVWYRDNARAAAPGRELLDVRMANDLVISRTGWSADDSVVALRSGGPANHEHADRNSVIFAAHGERLWHDPFKAAYVPTSPRWKLRLTEAHTAVLIDGKGHQYHDGHEGTNASWAWARVRAFATGEGWMAVTSEATEAYALVDPRVRLVERTLVFLKPDVLLVLDRVRLRNEPASVQLRFQVFNDDGGGKAEAQADARAFAITRPLAELRATVHARGGERGALRVRVGQLELPPEEGVFPFAEVESPAALDHAVLTVATAQTAGGQQGALSVTEEAEGWRVRGEHNGRRVDVRLTLKEEGVPNVVVT